MHIPALTGLQEPPVLLCWMDCYSGCVGEQDDPHIHTTARLDIGIVWTLHSFQNKLTNYQWNGFTLEVALHCSAVTPSTAGAMLTLQHIPTPQETSQGCARSHHPFAEIQVAAWELHTALESTGHLHSKEGSQEMCWPHGTSRSGGLKGVQLPLSWWCPLLQLWLGPWHPTCCCHSAES